MEASTLYDFRASNDEELSFHAGVFIKVQHWLCFSVFFLV